MKYVMYVFINNLVSIAVFHDVDLLPEDDRNLYSCPDQPRHMSVAVDKFQYKLPYKVGKSIKTPKN